MLSIEKKELQRLLYSEYQRGIKHGIKQMEEKLLLACENGTPINIEERAYFIKTDIQNLKDIFEDIKISEDD